MSAYCHGGKRVTKLPQKYWYSGSVKFCTEFEPRTKGADNENTENKDVDMIEEKNRILDESENIQEFNEAMHDMLLRNFFGEEIDGSID
jgi:hypothetical protein